METIELDVDTPAGEQARWLLERALSTDQTVEEVVTHIDPQALQGGPYPLAPEGFVELQRWAARALPSAGVDRVVEMRSSGPLDAEVTCRLDDGSTWTVAVRVGEEAPHRILDLQISVADDEPPADAGPGHTLVHCVDHFVVGLADPRAALDLLAGVLGLPVVLPWIELADGTGHVAVELGNAQLEFLNFAPIELQTPAHVQAIGFEPPPIDDALIAEIDRRGLVHTPPLPFTGYYTNIILFGLISDPDAFAFSCRYHLPGIRDRRARQATLDAVGGGELGVTGVVELVITATTWQESVERWQALFDPIAAVEPGYWRIGDGPAIKIVEGPEDAVREVVLGVRSVEQAATRVQELGVGTTEPAGDGVLLDLPPLNGLVIRLTEDTGPT